MSDPRRPVAPPRPMGVRPSSSTERPPERPPSERSDTIPRSLSERSGVRLSTTELTDLAEAASRRALVAWEREQREKGNEVVRAQAAVLEVKVARDNAIAKLEETSAHLSRAESGRTRLLYGIAALVLAVATLITERLTTGRVDAKAHDAALEVVEERAAPIEERAEAAATAAVTTETRQTAAEARELEREARLERLIVAIERQAAATEAKKKGTK